MAWRLYAEGAARCVLAWGVFASWPPRASSQSRRSHNRRSPPPRNRICCARPRTLPRPRAPAASPATRTPTTRTSRKRSSSAASIATAAIRRPTRQGAAPTSRRASPMRGGQRPIRCGPIPCSTTKSPEFIRFVNPGDLRIAHLSCGTGGCHTQEVLQNRMSMMTHGCMLWGAALYNNGVLPAQARPLRRKLQHERRAAALANLAAADGVGDQAQGRGAVPRSACRVSRSRSPATSSASSSAAAASSPRPASPNRAEEPGRPRARLSMRGLGTENRTDPVFVSLPAHAPARSDAQLPRHQRPPRRLSLQRLHRLPRHLRQRSLAGPLRALRPLRQSRHLAGDPDPTIPQGRAGPSDRAPLHAGHPDAASASSATSTPAPTS